MMRPVSREMDENEHEIPFSYVEFMHTAMKAMGGGMGGSLTAEEKKEDPNKPKRAPIGYQILANQLEMLSWAMLGCI